MKHRKAVVLLVVLLALLCSVSVYAAIPPFDITYSKVGDSNWLYTLYNNTAKDDNVIPYGLDLEWNEGEAPGSYQVVGSGAGWLENSSYGFPCWDADASTTEPSGGNWLSGFEISAPNPALNFTVYFISAGSMESFSGTATPVPEPGCLLSLLGGMACIGTVLRRTRPG